MTRVLRNNRVAPAGKTRKHVLCLDQLSQENLCRERDINEIEINTTRARGWQEWIGTYLATEYVGSALMKYSVKNSRS